MPDHTLSLNMIEGGGFELVIDGEVQTPVVRVFVHSLNYGPPWTEMTVELPDTETAIIEKLAWFPYVKVNAYGQVPES